MLDEASLSLMPEHIVQCWGMSKMTVENDIKLRANYQSMNFSEFLEFFCRVADLNYKDYPGLSSEPLVRRVEALMDYMFPTVIH